MDRKIYENIFLRQKETETARLPGRDIRTNNSSISELGM